MQRGSSRCARRVQVFELGKNVGRPGGASFFICSIGVSPTSLEMSSLTRRREVCGYGTARYQR